MCTFITMGFPAGTDRAALKTLLASHYLNDKDIVSPSVQALLPPGSLYLLSTRGFCSCGTVLGSLSSRQEIAPKEPKDAQIERLRKKGWSETKIARWKVDKAFGAENRGRNITSFRESSLDEAQRWVDFLVKALEPTPKGRLAEWAALFVRFYGGYFEDPIPVEGTKTVPLRDLDADWMLGLRYDVLYRFVPR